MGVLPTPDEWRGAAIDIEIVRSVSVRFYGSLNDFLPAPRRQSTLVCSVDSSPSVKDLVEALGVPHPVIDLLIVDGRSVDFGYRLRDGDRVAVYPLIRTLDIGDIVRLQPPPQTEPLFIADVHLGRLAAYLRLAGFDTKYRNDYPDEEIVAISASEDRVLLTRDIGVLKHGIVMRGYFLRETQPARQLVEVLREFDLVTGAAPFTRCLRCNSRRRSSAISFLFCRPACRRAVCRQRACNKGNENEVTGSERSRY